MLLIASPGMTDPRFARSVVFLCSHTSQGAMGIVINQLTEKVTLASVIDQLGIKAEIDLSRTRVHVGGPVETARGFVLHTGDYSHENTLVVDDVFSLSATIDVLRAIATCQGPKRHLFALGYSGWGAGQLDQEIQQNGWHLAPTDPDLLFDADDAGKWDRALRQIGVDPALLSVTAGHA